MIAFKTIDRSEHSLAEREELARQIDVDGSLPHVLLATCNRTELYWGDGPIDTSVARHLMRVASGLESALIGEMAIQGQLRSAYEEARHRYQLGSSLNRLFQTAIHVGKRVRTETAIATGAVSHSQVVADMLRDSRIDLRNQWVGIVGVNKLVEDLLKYLTSRGAVNFLLSNRNLDKAQALAHHYGGLALRLDNLPELLRRSTIVVSATSAPHYIVHLSDLDPQRAPQLMFDLAFPRDIDPAVASVPGLTLYNLDDIEAFAQRNQQRRHDQEKLAEAIIEEELDKLLAWYANKPRMTTDSCSCL